MGKALYRTYRSTSFDEVLGQDHVVSTLKNALDSGNVSHAYLLTGPRGVGKTSVARILACGVNGLSYQSDVNHVDIIEIDAASNRRIDEIRELRERVMIAPVSATYKVYIIDEVHMLTREAFNALLKTLEEPPEHVIFILATTEFHKLPDTIVSRCLRFNFKPIDTKTAAAHLRHIATNEKLKIDDDALLLIASHGDGSFRDSISQLDQIRGVGGVVSLEDVQQMLGVAPENMVTDLLESIMSGDPANLLGALSELYNHGTSPTTLSKQLSNHIRTQLLNNNFPLEGTVTIQLLKDLLTIQTDAHAKAQLEITLLSVLLTLSPRERHQPTTAAVKPADQIPEIKYEKPQTPIAHKPLADATATANLIPVVLGDEWISVLADIKAKNNTLYSIARMASTEFLDDKLVITFNFAFHHKQISEPKNKNLITDVVKAKYPNIATIDIQLASKVAKSEILEPKPSANDQNFSSITNIFGGGEVLES